MSPDDGAEATSEKSEAISATCEATSEPSEATPMSQELGRKELATVELVTDERAHAREAAGTEGEAPPPATVPPQAEHDDEPRHQHPLELVTGEATPMSPRDGQPARS